MKNKLNLKNKKGMTLIELTVVILVLLSLISVLFIGAAAWKKGSDRAQCILNIRNAQTAGRSWQNMNQKVEGDTVAFTTDIAASGKFLESAPVCPEDTKKGFATSYDPVDKVPAIGSLYIECLINASEHVPASKVGW